MTDGGTLNNSATLR